MVDIINELFGSEMNELAKHSKVTPFNLFHNTSMLNSFFRVKRKSKNSAHKKVYLNVNELCI
jgi:hypothetical protein